MAEGAITGTQAPASFVDALAKLGSATGPLVSFPGFDTTAGPDTGPSDDTPPVVSNVSPTNLDQLAPTATVQFDVTDDSGSFCFIGVNVVFAGLGIQEVIHDGDGFGVRYVALSSRVPITDGFRYTIRRSGGWPATAAELRIKAIDAAGNEAT